VAAGKDEVYAAAADLFSYSPLTQEYQRYSKVNGLNDVNIQLLSYDATWDVLLILYENSNMDLKQGSLFYNIPDIKNASFTGSKRIHSVFIHQNLFYLCSDFGIVVLNPVKKEIKETYVLQKGSGILSVYGLAVSNGYFYAATSDGLYKAPENSSALQNFATWVPLQTIATQHLFSSNGNLYTAGQDSLFRIQQDTLFHVYTAGSEIQSIRTGTKGIYVCERNDLRKCIVQLNADAVWVDSIAGINPNDVCEDASGRLWEADEWEGLIQLGEGKQKNYFHPNGVYDASCYNLMQQGDKIYVMAGGESAWEPMYSSGGISVFDSGEWKWINRYSGYAAMDTVFDFCSAAIDTRNQYLYASSFGGGLLEIHPDKSSVVYKDNGFLQSQIGNPGANVVPDLVFDDQHNLWMTNYGAAAQLVVKKADNSWQNFSLPFPGGEKYVSRLVIGDDGKKWIIGARGIGVLVYDDHGTIDLKNDDESRLLTTGSGNGNLPSNEVLSIAKDRNGKIWIGTNDGIGIVNCPENILSTNGCDAELKIVKYDLNAGLLFQKESVNTIAVDGANNKWIGTNNGVWLISDDAEKIIYRFSKDNSPLPSNEIKRIIIQPESGEVFIATAAGLVSYRAQATEPSADASTMNIFPNPVPPGYTGLISIRNLSENADVRITDASGQLVYRTRSQGGQAVWNGKNYLGEKPVSGVYFVLVTSYDGTQSTRGKFIYHP